MRLKFISETSGSSENIVAEWTRFLVILIISALG